MGRIGYHYHSYFNVMLLKSLNKTHLVFVKYAHTFVSFLKYVKNMSTYLPI